MSKTLYFCALALVVIAFTNNAASAQSKSIFESWPALGAFHDVMSATFHPAEEGNLEPIRSRSKEMYEKATALAKSDVPAEFNKPAILMAVKNLRSGSKSLNKMVKKQSSDADLTKSLTALHDVFHEIVGLCRDENH